MSTRDEMKEQHVQDRKSDPFHTSGRCPHETELGAAMMPHEPKQIGTFYCVEVDLNPYGQPDIQEYTFDSPEERRAWCRKARAAVVRIYETPRYD